MPTHLRSRNLPGPMVRLYDVQSDPQEQHDLATDKPELVKQLQQSLANWKRHASH